MTAPSSDAAPAGGLSPTVRAGLLSAAAAYGIWGLFTLYFKLVADVPPWEVVAHRILWAMAVTVPAVLLIGRRRDFLEVLATPRLLRIFVASAAMVSLNWMTFVHAVGTDRTLQSSMGYFIFPLVMVGFGRVFLGERLDRRQAVAMGLVFAGVAVMVLRVGEFPWIALVLAVTFSLYGLLRKLAPTQALVGLAVETTLLAPPAFVAVAVGGLAGWTAFGRDAAESLSLIAAGPVTALPLLLFAMATRRLRLGTVGLMQFINPSIQFAVAVLVFGEPFTGAHLLAFGCIWCGLAVYAWPVRGPPVGRPR